jgi:LysR family transcriptional regulator, regulator for bpeEF and oprC
LDRIELFKVFVRVVDSANFTRAADALKLPRSSVSAAVQELETRVGVRLLHRTTRRVSPTREGAAFYERCLQVIAHVEETEGLFQAAPMQPRGTLRLDVPSRIGRLIVAPALPQFLERYPEVEVFLGMSDRAVNLIEEEVDCVVRVGQLNRPGQLVLNLGNLSIVNVASPAYLDKHGTPRSPADLKGHFSVRYASPATGETESWEWLEDGKLRSAPMQGRATVNNAEAYIACCLAGLGLIQVPGYDVAAHLAAGELVEVMPRHRAAPMPISLIYPRREYLSRRLQLLTDWLESILAQSIEA